MKIGLVGRTNVGKSTLFNRFLGAYRAIVTDIKGTTKENFQELVDFGEDQKSKLIDSPGLSDFDQEKKFIEEIIKESDIIVFLVDGKVGLTKRDEEIKQMIISLGKKNNTIVAVNKMEGNTFSDKGHMMMADFYSLGFENVIAISAKEGDSVEDLKDELIDLAEKNDLNFMLDTFELEDKIPVSIVGRPNVGKSTLLNKIYGEHISNVNEESGTTLDYITTDIEFQNQKYKFFDTAGIRKKGRLKGLEKIAYSKTYSMLKYNRPIVVLMINMEEGVTHRDKTLLAEIEELQLPLMIAVNKTDLYDRSDLKKMFDYVMQDFNFVKWVPIIPISAKEGVGIPKLFSFINNIWEEFNKRISTSQLNKILSDSWIINPPRFPKSKICKFYYISQVEEAPPKFVVFVNKKENVNFSFKNWIENNIRKNYGFIGVPIEISFKERESYNR